MKITPKNNERSLDKNTLLVTKTDLKGKIIYANRAFMRMVQLGEDDLVGAPHNIIRHPDMPKIIFKYLWNYLQKNKEIHAYVKNLCADGSYYWVMANVTPSFNIKRSNEQKEDEEFEVVGYHSSRRLPSKEAMSIIIPLYAKLLEAEKRGGISASEQIMQDLLKDKEMEYEEFILSI